MIAAGALFFDLDGTLIHSDPLHLEIFVEMYAARGVRLDEAHYLRHIHGRRTEASFAEAFPEEDADALAIWKEEEFVRRLPDVYPPMPGLEALLGRAAAEGWATAVVTNAPRDNAARMLRAIGLEGRFGTVVLSEDCARGKPHPDPYLEAMRRTGVDTSGALVFEDSPAGIAAARAAGLFTIGLRSSLTDAALREAGADATISDYTDPALDPLLARLKGQGQ
jgi:HAD superfamily hydrolase (TIGR01509 family)